MEAVCRVAKDEKIW